jgi:hypothetical protein
MAAVSPDGGAVGAGQGAGVPPTVTGNRFIAILGVERGLGRLPGADSHDLGSSTGMRPISVS